MRRARSTCLAVVAALALVGATPVASAPRDPALPPGALARIDAVQDAARPEARVRATQRGSVSSPLTVQDPANDSSPYHSRGEVTAYQIRNGPAFVDLRFWTVRRPDTWNTADTGFIVRLDLAANGLGRDYDVVVASSRQTGKFAAVGEPDFDEDDEITCVSPNVTELGRGPMGNGYSARFQHRCIGGEGAFSSRAQLVYSWFRNDPLPTVDVVPNRKWTATVRPA